MHTSTDNCMNLAVTVTEAQWRYTGCQQQRNEKLDAQMLSNPISTSTLGRGEADLIL